MLTNENYRLCARTSLQILKDERQELYRKCLSYDVMLYLGLHERRDELRTLYYQYTITDWLDSHWIMLHDILKCHPEYTYDKKRQITLFFAYFLYKMIKRRDLDSIYSKLHAIDFLQDEKQILYELITTSEHWEENSRRLQLEKKKNDEKFARLIEQYNLEKMEEL